MTGRPRNIPSEAGDTLPHSNLIEATMDSSVKRRARETQRRITRARARHRCTECARRRVRCDSQQPCGACQSAHLECLPQDNTHLKNGSTKSVEESPGDHFARLEQIIDETIVQHGPSRSQLSGEKVTTSNVVPEARSVSKSETQYINPLSWEAMLVSLR